MPAPIQLSYMQSLKNPRLASFLAGDMLSRIGDGMTLVALPVLALELRGTLAPAFVLSMVYAIPLLAPLLVSLWFGLGTRRFAPGAVVAADALLRSFFYGIAALLALTGALSLGWLVALLSAGSLLRLLAASGRRLFALNLVGPAGSYAVNGMIGTSLGVGMFILGPVFGGLSLTSGSAAPALLCNAGTYLVLLAVLWAVKRHHSGAIPSAPTTRPGKSGVAILRSQPQLMQLFCVFFVFDLFYAPVEVALPLLLMNDLGLPSPALGTLWTSYGIGALLGALSVNYLRRLPAVPLLLAVIVGWALSMAALGMAASGTSAFLIFAIAGLVYGPFNPLVFIVLQQQVPPEEQQPVFTLWTAGITLAMPLGLALAGPLVAVAQARGSSLGRNIPGPGDLFPLDPAETTAPENRK
ncbi:MFS transporter [Arthrobacter sp. Sa2BUA2]|uniref:MFS transporter n=1 Tax=Arthrobacter pullicola TaxID=2762224 RepID=A0ABR8YEJ0_9MICC|nr:MFS transporter [Arthrobacter pullicola]MBD8042646.1 MFS transporter [Arthrobacter pullicola]